MGNWKTWKPKPLVEPALCLLADVVVRGMSAL
jgi:hypothetical protein